MYKDQGLHEISIEDLGLKTQEAQLLRAATKTNQSI